MARKITDKQREESWRMYEQGKSIKDISEFVCVSYTSAWSMTEGRRQGFKNHSEYKESLAQKKGFKNSSEYQESLAQNRSKNHLNKELSYLIKFRLSEMGRNQSWLAKQIGVTRQTVSLYSMGKIIPSDGILNKMFVALEVEERPKSLDYLVEE